ncbi:MAG: endolytic transglycosylase MltG [Candidatus Falkowbacteria bacterium]
MWGNKQKQKSKKIKRWFFIGTLILLVVFLSYTYERRLQNKLAVEAARAKAALSAEKSITLIEGWNLKEIQTYLVKRGFADAKDLTSLKMKDYRGDYLFMADAPANASLEGYFFPDTYRVYASSTLDDIVKKSLDNFQSKFTADFLMEAKRQNKSVYQILTMASVLEKEVKSESDMKIVSGVFWNRIKNGQALQSCASLAYILGVNKPQYSYEETRTPSAYNTYLNKGLPPGPICSPSLKAIRAALYPTQNDYNYFLSDPATGKTIFSKTYEEHLRNKNKYLK